MFSFKRNSQPVFQSDCHFAFSTAMNGSCFESLPVFHFANILDLGHSNRRVLVSHWCFCLQYSWWCMTLAIFWYAYLPPVISSLMSYMFRSEVINSVVSFLTVEFKSSLYILHNSSLSDTSWKYFLPNFGLSVHFPDNIFFREKF